MSNLESKLITDNMQLWEGWKPTSQAERSVDRLKSGQPVRLIGPCAAQSKEQVLAILAVTASHSDGLRLPDKKPRTRPVKPDGTRQFLGIGHSEVLSIYRTVAEKYPHLAIGAETMSEADVSLLSKTGLLGFAWSGSRTQEQETLQDLGRAAEETNTLMMIKNPLVSDQEMYLGMMENWILGSSGRVPLVACVRGGAPLSSAEREVWRNTPNFDLIDALIKSFPALPIIVDPSHMVKAPRDEVSKSERLNTVVNLICRGLDHGARGYMVEVHHPDYPSWTDPGENVYDLMDKLDKHGLV